MILPLTDEEKAKVIGSYDHVYAIMQRILGMEDEVGRQREHLWVMGFQTLDTIKYIELVALGQLNRVSVPMREVFQLAVSLNCPRLLVIHNHPEPQLRFSKADAGFTAQVIGAGNLLDIDVMDHLLITYDQGYKSAMYPKGDSPFNGKG